MGFLQNCILRKNSKEIAKALIEMGYHTYDIKEYGGCPEYWSIVVEVDIAYAGIWNNMPNNNIINDFIDCGDNEKMFLALAALRDDSDLYQWFVYPKIKYIKLPGYFPQMVGMDGTERIIEGYEWHVSYRNDLTIRINDAIKCGEDPKFLPHKATVKEIIDHFK